MTTKHFDPEPSAEGTPATSGGGVVELPGLRDRHERDRPVHLADSFAEQPRQVASQVPPSGRNPTFRVRTFLHGFRPVAFLPEPFPQTQGESDPGRSRALAPGEHLPGPQHQEREATVRTPREVAVSFLLGVCGFEVPDELSADDAKAQV